MDSHPILQVIDLKKSFGHVEALKKVSFEIYPGEVMGLLGDNGAGKSTLIKLIMGVHRADSGKLIFQGKDVTSSLDPSKARDLGIEAVPQGGAVVPFMPITRNFFLGREPRKNFLGFIKTLDITKMNEDATRLVREVGVRVRSTRERVSVLSGGERQAVSIGRILYFQSSLVLLDEPTLNLSVKETDKLLSSVAEMKQKGVGIIFVTHNVYHVYSVADKFLILDHGQMIGTYRKEDVTAEEVIDMIRTGKPLEKQGQVD